RRPWLPTQATEQQVRVLATEADKVALAQIAAAASLPIPDPLPESPRSALTGKVVTLPEQDGALDPSADAQMIHNLPPYFNWCSQGKCTPIRDQRMCGSCWAFATVGAMESAVLIARPDISPNMLNFSEQFLVSCNRRGWGCDGGWWGHDYHTNLPIVGEPMAGPVGERFFPYQAADVPCRSPYPHFWQAKAWRYVDPVNPFSVPSVNQLKQAILRYGPISVAVWAGPAFMHYRGGVFRTNEAPSKNAVNHGVVLVGWDDSQQAWIMRNSWGASWGEGGYMRIGYGVSNIGYKASYVDGARLFNRRAFMPIVGLRPSNLNTFPIPDGDFEGRVEAWWLGGYAAVTSYPRRSGQRSMWLGGIPGYTDAIRQPMLIPPQATHLRFWRFVHAGANCGGDFARVRIGGQALRTYPLCDASVIHGQWVEERIDIQPFRGQQHQIVIEAIIDQTSGAASFYVDDVAFVR
ncbi:MAG: C1 family peptidase, partial [Thermoflexales bacterium]|nr:C1 family peptidase [Thermoflexales bacterium]